MSEASQQYVVSGDHASEQGAVRVHKIDENPNKRPDRGEIASAVEPYRAAIVSRQRDHASIIRKSAIKLYLTSFDFETSHFSPRWMLIPMILAVLRVPVDVFNAYAQGFAMKVDLVKGHNYVEESYNAFWNPEVEEKLKNISGTYVSPGSGCVGKNHSVGYVELVFGCLS